MNTTDGNRWMIQTQSTARQSQRAEYRQRKLGDCSDPALFFAPNMPYLKYPPTAVGGITDRRSVLL